MKMAESTSNGLKTWWEKEKLLVTSNFSFSLSVFKGLVLQTHQNQGLFGKGLILIRWVFKGPIKPLISAVYKLRAVALILSVLMWLLWCKCSILVYPTERCKCIAM